MRRSLPWEVPALLLPIRSIASAHTLAMNELPCCAVHAGFEGYRRSMCSSFVKIARLSGLVKRLSHALRALHSNQSRCVSLRNRTLVYILPLSLALRSARVREEASDYKDRRIALTSMIKDISNPFQHRCVLPSCDRFLAQGAACRYAPS